MMRKSFQQMLVIVCSFSVLIIMAIWGKSRQERHNAPVFSKESGFYDENFYLSINAGNGATIYYTLDGSIPTEESFVYTEPLLIEDATSHENVYSMNTDTSAGFYTELIEKYESKEPIPGYKAPDYLVNKCTIVRAKAVYADGVVSDIATGSYFVGFWDDSEEYDGCNFISIITEPANLFDEKQGIYVTGTIFDYYMKSEQEEIQEYWPWWDANYRQSGRAWEREAIFQFFDEEGKLIVSKEGGMRIRGGASRGLLPKGLNLYAREESDEEESFGVTLFDNEYIPQSVSLTSGGNHVITQFGDYMITQRTENLKYTTLKYEPYILFLDGEYWGFYWLAEKYDEKYLEYHYEVDPAQVVVIKDKRLKIGDDRDFELYSEMREYIKAADMSYDANFSKACELIDMESYLDYYATMIYIARCEDWPGLNTALWRTKTNSGYNYSDGKWRWMMYDCNSTCMWEDKGKSLASHDTLSYVIDRDSVFASLWKNESFRRMFKERIFYIADNCFDAKDMNDFINDYNQEMVPILAASWKRFYGSDNEIEHVYYNMMESHREFFKKRRITVETWFEGET